MYWLEKIREFKNEKGLTYKDIANRTGIALTTVEKLFSGRTNDPKLIMISQITNVLGHSISELLSDTSCTFVLSDIEREMILKIRRLDEFGETRVNDTIKSETRRMEAESKKQLTYSRIYYDFPVSAGTGEFLDNRTAVIAELSCKPPRGTDYILRISGNSMEPQYSDGDYVYVNSRETIDFGEIGIFVAEGSVYMKEYTPDGLRSLNPDYKIIRFYDDVRCLGKVIGILQGEIDITSN